MLPQLGTGHRKVFGRTARRRLNVSLNVKVPPRFDGEVGIRYFGIHGERVPRGRANHVAQAMEAALRREGYEFNGADLDIYSSVPVGVGLGSTTAAVVAGVLAADRLFGLGLEETTLLELAALTQAITHPVSGYFTPLPVFSASAAL